MSTEGNRAELAAFLRARRTQLDRAALGLPDGPRRRSTGLRREEVAATSGVSVTWYTWLEQGRDVNPSRQVLDALARALQLTGAEHGYLLAVAGFSPAPPTPDPGLDAPAHVQHLVDALVGCPTVVLTPDWSIAAWNQPYEALYPRVAVLAGRERNLLRAVFTDPFVRELLPDWEATSRRFLAEFRAEAGPRLALPECRRLVAELSEVSAEFRDGWRRARIEGFASRRRSFLTAEGVLEFEHHRLVLSDPGGLSVVAYTPTDRGTAQRLAALSGPPPLRPGPAYGG